MRKLVRGGFAVTIAVLLTLVAGVSASQSAPVGHAADDPSVMIVGGVDATTLDGAVSIQYGGRHRCTGNLITQQWVLTAAHCAPILVVGETQVRAGSLDWSVGGELVGIQQVALNPVFTGEVVRGDHALVKLDRRVRARAIPMALDPGRVGTPGRISGWGVTCQNPALPECAVAPRNLQELRTVVIDPGLCDLGTTPTGVPIFSPKTEVCIASADGQARMACHGDSGGGLTRKFGNRRFLVATTSGDGDDLELRPDYCSTSPSGGQGSGMSAKVGPSYRWIVLTLLSADPAAEQELVRTTWQQDLP